MKSSYLWALVICAVVGLWLATSFIDFNDMALKPVAEQRAVNAGPDKPFRVRVKTYRSKPRAVSVTVRGQTKASRRVEVRARTRGIVLSSPLREGEEVKTGKVMCTLDIAERKAKLAEAKSALISSQRDYDATAKLSQNKFASAAKVASDKARVEAAQARVDQILREIEYTRIKAPISGIVESRPAEKGAFLQVGGTCATLIDLDPILVTVMVPERDIGFLKIGMKASAKLVTGDVVEGFIRHIAAKADVRTRTFEVELEAPNPGGRIREGITSELNIPLNAGSAHLIPASALTLSDNGQIGVSALADANRVKFWPTKVLAFERETVWVAGLPDTLNIITLGQEYVIEGQVVEPVTGTDEKGVKSSQ